MLKPLRSCLPGSGAGPALWLSAADDQEGGTSVLSTPESQRAGAPRHPAEAGSWKLGGEGPTLEPSPAPSQRAPGCRVRTRTQALQPAS